MRNELKQLYGKAQRPLILQDGILKTEKRSINIGRLFVFIKISYIDLYYFGEIGMSRMIENDKRIVGYFWSNNIPLLRFPGIEIIGEIDTIEEPASGFEIVGNTGNNIIHQLVGVRITNYITNTSSSTTFIRFQANDHKTIIRLDS